jgi:hypothetical protein
MAEKDPVVTVNEEPASSPTPRNKPFDQGSPEDTRAVGAVYDPDQRLDQEGKPVGKGKQKKD